MDGPKTSRLVALILMWLIWSTILLGIAILLAFAYVPNPESNTWILEFTWVVAIAVFLAIPLSLRFLVVPKISNPWIVFLVFLAGVFFADMIAIVGMFALLSGQHSYILIGVLLLFLYCPHWLTNRDTANKTQPH